MLGLKASHASWELKGLLLLPGKSLPGGEALSPEWGQATPLASSSLPWGWGPVGWCFGLWLGRGPASSPPSHLETAMEEALYLQGFRRDAEKDFLARAVPG